MAMEGEPVVAVLALRGQGGQALFEATTPLTSGVIDGFEATPAVAREAADLLVDAGFEVVQFDRIAMSFRGPRARFEAIFGARLRKDRRILPDGRRVEVLGVAEAEAGRLLALPAAFGQVAAGVALARPPALAMPLPPPELDQPDPSAHAACLPEELARLVGAVRLHRLGVTGRQVTVAMLDTGCYGHPYFARQGHRRLPTLLGPGQAAPARDDHGHGTGQAAQLLAAAPDCRLRPIKGLIDPTGDLHLALGSLPRPQVICAAWGYALGGASWAELQARDLGLFCYLKTLEAAIAQAVAQGCVICAAAGGAGQTFPAAHPEVIAVGGTAPRAARPAAAGRLYPDRPLPDLHGLLAPSLQQPGIAGAPAPVLPVQPGSVLDQRRGTRGRGDGGWAIFGDGTAACSLIAGVTALLLERDPSITPHKVKALLLASTRELKADRRAAAAAAGSVAQGAGLIDARWAWLMTMGDAVAEFIAAPHEQRSALMSAGLMPGLPREFLADVIARLRCH